MLKYAIITTIVTSGFFICVSTILQSVYVEELEFSIHDCLLSDGLCYYILLVPLTIPVCGCCWLLKWWGLMFFKHN